MPKQRSSKLRWKANDVISRHVDCSEKVKMSKQISKKKKKNARVWGYLVLECWSLTHANNPWGHHPAQ